MLKPGWNSRWLTKTPDPLVGLVTAGDVGNFLQHSLQGAFFDSYSHHFIEDRSTDQTIPAVLPIER